MAERIVAAAPKLLAVSNATQQAEVSAEIADQVGQLERLYKHLRHSDMDGLDDIGDDIARISLNLSRLDTSVASHLALEQERRTIVSEVLKSAQIARTGSKPGRVLIESRLAEWRRSFADPEPLWLIIGSADLSAALDSLLPLQRAELVIATLASMTHSVAAADDHANLAGLVAPLEHSLEQLREHVANFPESMRSRAEHQLATFEDGLMGEGGLVVVRGLELQALQEAQAVLDDNARISEHLTLATDQLISDAGRVISASAADAASIHDFSSRVLIAVALLSIISSGLIVMLYVDRNLLHRLSALSGSMLAVADGNLRVRLPPADGGDEIAEMARALTVFRDTAVEIEDKGLREIDRARQRLIDAIESISEGFAFYGRDDRLELCNSRCVELLYGGTGIKIDPGTTFEAMIRRAVESGLIREAVGSPEHYIRLRLAQHRNPGSPILQQRADGRWIVIAERKVSGGGTVAVYSDITELKCREIE
ncbi:MAG: PAS-domain containing protein, partial [Pseudomonadota bacterium]